jgi:hypothetical protein
MGGLGLENCNLFLKNGTLGPDPGLELVLQSDPNRPKILDPYPDLHCDPQYWKGKFTERKICNVLGLEATNPRIWLAVYAIPIGC